MKAAGVVVSIHGDEKGGSKAFSAGTYDASESKTPDSDGLGWVQKGVKAFGETTAANGVTGRNGGKFDTDVFALIDLDSTSGLKLQAKEYKIAVADEKWDGNDTGDIAQFKVVKGANGRTDEVTNGKFTADGNSDYFLEISGAEGEDAQYSVFLELA